jgi:hypothetical protein
MFDSSFKMVKEFEEEGGNSPQTSKVVTWDWDRNSEVRKTQENWVNSGN